jgi:poly-beta-1,6-N-acetyl-D-glucosamine synthase
MIYLFIAVFAIYFILLLFLLAGWQKAIHSSGKSIEVEDTHPFISVVIPFRNEQDNLPHLIKSLSSQEYADFEVILIDDHSTDEGVSVLHSLIKQDARFRVLATSAEGKKKALTTGIDAAIGSVIVTTDADCVHPSGWLKRFSAAFQDSAVKMVFGWVSHSPSKGLWYEVQALEFTAVVATGASLHALNIPSFCNGANLAFRRTVFMEVGGYSGNFHIPSGDDEFLYKKILGAYPSGVLFISDPSSRVETRPAPSLSQFLAQRLRWAGKWRHTPGVLSGLIAIFMVVFQLTVITAWLVLFHADYSRIAAFLLAGKMLLEYIFLFNINHFAERKVRMIPFLFLQITYPFYVITVGILSNVVSYRWKDRHLVTKASPVRQI